MIAWLGALLLGAAGVLSSTIVLVFCLVVLGINLLLSVLLVGNVHDIFNQVDSRRNDVVRYRDAFGLRIKTPNINKLMEIGTTFENAFTGSTTDMFNTPNELSREREAQQVLVVVVPVERQLLFTTEEALECLLEGSFRELEEDDSLEDLDCSSKPSPLQLLIKFSGPSSWARRCSGQSDGKEQDLEIGFRGSNTKCGRLGLGDGDFDFDREVLLDEVCAGDSEAVVAAAVETFSAVSNSSILII